MSSFSCIYWTKQCFFTGSVRVHVEQLPVGTHMAGGNTVTRGTSPCVSLVPPVATVRHSHPVFTQHRHQTACCGEWFLIFSFFHFTIVLQKNRNFVCWLLQEQKNNNSSLCVQNYNDGFFEPWELSGQKTWGLEYIRQNWTKNSELS